MLYTAFMLVMFGWMLLLVLQFGMAALPVVILLTAIMTSIRLVQYASFTRTKVLVRLSAKAR
jgi:hypothetical protein